MGGCLCPVGEQNAILISVKLFFFYYISQDAQVENWINYIINKLRVVPLGFVIRFMNTWNMIRREKKYHSNQISVWDSHDKNFFFLV